VTAAWAVVVVVGVATMAIKASGPVLLGERELPAWLQGALEQLAPALLAALVAVNVLASGRRLVLDARVVGLLAAVVALRLRAPTLVVVVVAAVATALARLV
jgi:branched-subunit amino acid transport protein